MTRHAPDLDASDAARGLAQGGLGGPEDEILDAGQEEVFSRTEVEQGVSEHHEGEETPNTGVRAMTRGLKTRLPKTAAHLCIDMQRMFVEATQWHAPWAGRTLPVIETLCSARPDQLWFTRFIPAETPDNASGVWRDYWRHWSSMTKSALEPELLDLARPLQRFAPPTQIIDKTVYSAGSGTHLHEAFVRRGVDTLIVTGTETDVCVLASVLGAIDLGYRIVVVSDGVCSWADKPHDHLLALYSGRFSLQVETAGSREVLEAWAE